MAQVHLDLDINLHDDPIRLPLSILLDKIVINIGKVVMWANVILMMTIISQVTLRYVSNMNFPKLDEMQWHLYGLTTMFGLSYALATDNHVRVDVFRMGLSIRTKRLIKSVGIICLTLPFCGYLSIRDLIISSIATG